MRTMTATARLAIMAAVLVVALPVMACGYHGNSAVGAGVKLVI
jgi:hypothetical protein